MKIIDTEKIHVMEGTWSSDTIIRDIVESGTQEDPFYVFNVGEVVARYHQWKELLPRVEPFYAVKCNDDKLLVTTLAALGAGFDCASKKEIELISSIGVAPERIIFANPAKMASHIRYAALMDVTMMTFDSETELMKIKFYIPHAELVIRIRCDAAAAQCPLGIKFGCDPVTEAPRLLKLAAVLGLKVVGVSFHVGSGAQEIAVYGRAIAYARALFVMGMNIGHTMRLLDIGGGFPGGSGSSIVEVAQVINHALDQHFMDRGVRVIAEPGRYFAAAAYTLACSVHAKRELASKEGDDGEMHTMYFMNDGVYGSFNCCLYDHQVVTPEVLAPTDEVTRPSSLWGPTCDGLDCVVPSCMLPPLAMGTWMVFRNMGAYTLPVASPFNGFPVPRVRAVVDRRLWAALRELHPLSEANFTPPAPAPAPAPAAVPAMRDLVRVGCALK